jgi:DNA-binding NarL/FixJ family response regulator
LIVEDRRTSPAQTAAMRLDFEAWLSQMPSRRRRIAECLAQGEQTRDVAKQFRISAGRISQLREQFRRSWERFQAE